MMAVEVVMVVVLSVETVVTMLVVVMVDVEMMMGEVRARGVGVGVGTYHGEDGEDDGAYVEIMKMGLLVTEESKDGGCGRGGGLLTVDDGGSLVLLMVMVVLMIIKIRLAAGASQLRVSAVRPVEVADYDRGRGYDGKDRFTMMVMVVVLVVEIVVVVCDHYDNDYVDNHGNDSDDDFSRQWLRR